MSVAHMSFFLPIDALRKPVSNWYVTSVVSVMDGFGFATKTVVYLAARGTLYMRRATPTSRPSEACLLLNINRIQVEKNAE